MEIPKDTFKFQIVSDAFKINQNFDQKIGQVIIIENKDKSIKEKKINENPILISFIYPLLITLIAFFVTRYTTRKRIKAERELINEKINQIKRDFQPYVLATLQKTQETILKAKLNTLREIVKFKTDFFNVSNVYIDGIGVIDDMSDYYQNVYCVFFNDEYLNIRNLVLLNGYLFPNNIKEELKKILNDLSNILDIQNREYSKQNSDLPDDALEILKNLSSKFDNVIEDIRKDLHLDDSFIHDFIEKYKKI